MAAQPTSRAARTLVLRQLWPGRWPALALAGALVAMVVLPLAAPQLTRRFVDGAIGGESLDTLLLIAVGYLVLAVCGQVARLLTSWLASRLAWDSTNRLREALAEHALGLDMSYHGQRTPGEMIERVDGDVMALSDFIVAFVLDVVASVLLLAGVLVMVFTVDLRIGAVLAVYCVVMGFGMVRAQRLAVPAATRMRERSAALFGNLEERLAGAEDIRANGAGHHVVNRFHRVAADRYRADLRNEQIGGGIFAGTSVVFALGTGVVLGLAAWTQQAGALTVGTAVLLFQYTQMVREPFERLIDQLRKYQRALAAVARMGGLLAERPTVTQPAEARRLPEGPLSLEMTGVGFAYPDDDQPVLSDVTLRLEPGETLGLVGRTGSGKTTVARLALRLYDPTRGVVRLGGVDLREADLASVRRRAAIVTQDVQLFADTVRDNLTLFRPDLADDSRLREVLTRVGLAEWLAQLPDGLDTVLGPQGGGASAGEGQLLAFARAFLTDPGLVVLDEAASRLDPATEQRIEEAVDLLLCDRTAVLIAHRLSSLSRVDKVAVVEAGRVVEYGPRRRLAADPDSRFGRMLAAAGIDGRRFDRSVRPTQRTPVEAG